MLDGNQKSSGIAPEEEDTNGEETVSYKDEGDATTGLGALLAGLKL